MLDAILEAFGLSEVRRPGPSRAAKPESEVWLALNFTSSRATCLAFIFHIYNLQNCVKHLRLFFNGVILIVDLYTVSSKELCCRYRQLFRATMKLKRMSAALAASSSPRSVCSHRLRTPSTTLRSERRNDRIARKQDRHYGRKSDRSERSSAAHRSAARCRSGRQQRSRSQWRTGPVATTSVDKASPRSNKLRRPPGQSHRRTCKAGQRVAPVKQC